MFIEIRTLIMKVRKIILSLILFFSGYSVSDVYKCTIDGKPVFTDQPCGTNAVNFKALNVVSPVTKGEVKEVNIEYSSSKWFVGHAGYKKALKTSKLYKVPMFVYFQADWCRYCNILEKELLDTRQGKGVLRKVVKVIITPDNSLKEDRLFKEFGGTGYPSVFIKKSSVEVANKYYLLKKKGNTSVAKSISYLKKVIRS